MSNTMTDAAKAYLTRGWDPIRLHGVNDKGICTCKDGAKPGHTSSAGKHPTDSDWASAPRMTEDGIDKAWSGWRSGHNVGLRTGRPSGFFVLDIDPDNGGTESVKRLQAEHEPLTAHAVQKTGSSGWHLLFTMPEDFEPTNRRGGLKEYPGLDIRGTGGQIVAAPSTSAKGPYSWLNDGEPGPAPEWLLDLLRPAPAAEPVVAPPTQKSVTPLDDEEMVRVEAYSARVRDLEVGRLVAMQEAATRDGAFYRGEPWNQTTFDVACALLELANSPWTLYDAAQAWVDVRDHAPVDSDFELGEHEKCFRSAQAKVGDNARPYPAARPDAREEVSSWLNEPGVRVDPILLKGKTPPPNVVVAEEAPHRVMPQRSWDDLGNAMRVVDHFGDFLRWVDEAEQWAIFQRGRWQLVKPNVVQGYIQRMIDELVPATEGLAYSNVPEDEDKPEETPRTKFEKWLKAQRMSARIAAAQKEASGRRELHASKADFDAHPLLLNVANGVVDLQTGALLPHDPKLLLMKQASVVYDPAASAPLWQAFLDRVQPDVQMQAYLRRTLGYALTGDIREQAFFIWHGDGANGKSIAAGIMSTIMGDYGQAVAPSTLLSGTQDEHPTGVAMMDGRRWLPATETAPGRRLDEAKVKDLTGGQPVPARFMGKDFFEYVPVGKIVLITNHLPRLSDANSIWRRIHLIKWGVSIPYAEQDRTLEHKLMQELPGILAWLVRGTQEWLSLGLLPPTSALQDLGAYRDDSDVFGDFLRECTMAAPRDTRTGAQPLYESYRAWTFRQNIKAMSMQAFVATMTERRFERYRDSTSRGFCGIVPISQTAVAPWDAA